MYLFFFGNCDLCGFCWKFKAALTLLHFVGAGHVRPPNLTMAVP